MPASFQCRNVHFLRNRTHLQVRICSGSRRNHPVPARSLSLIEREIGALHKSIYGILRLQEGRHAYACGDGDASIRLATSCSREQLQGRLYEWGRMGSVPYGRGTAALPGHLPAHQRAIARPDWTQGCPGGKDRASLLSSLRPPPQLGANSRRGLKVALGKSLVVGHYDASDQRPDGEKGDSESYLGHFQAHD